MTPIFTARRRAEEFADAVDGNTQAPAAHRAETAELVSVASALRDADPVQPRAEFSADLRARLMAEAATALTPETAALALPQRRATPHRRRLVAAASAAVLVGGTATMATAAQDALPGEALYPLKRGIEQARTGLSTGPAEKGQSLLDQADGRLLEVEDMVEGDGVVAETEVPRTLESFADQASEGSDLLLGAYEQGGDPADIVAVRAFAADGMESLVAVADTVPTDAQDELTDAALLLQTIDQRALDLCASCSDLPDLRVPGVLLARAEVDRALEAAGFVPPSNDHPVVVPPGTLSGLVGELTLGTLATDGTRSGDGSSTTGGDGGSDATDPVPTPKDWQPEDLVTPLLPGSGDVSAGTSGGGARDKEDPVGEVTKELESTTRTLLPDADGGDLLD
jgi:hypothetical protein